ncbi:hypothetical protein A3K86_14640 [Photobacterium jeanii]|uniref:Uncharacterized protein n=1 Tax=Photobacterium jeanii TaxID=858640 RepID=A0A178KAQ5_9GAMM|nr:hypothetical protein [Photobacterium jeanii]OAN13794.1 hypothetical protein A3K86_14640 [Photobacterium jeanii]PST92745.1 hypothetical protein C9I91_06160 [Photobacterium jeanii]
MQKPCFIACLCLAVPPTIASEYLSETAKHAPAPVSPNFSKAAVVDNKDQDDPSESELIWKGVTSSFDVPFEEWAERSEDDSWLKGLSGNLGLGHPLLKTEAANVPANATNGPSNNNTIATLSLKYVIIGNWFVSGTLYYYFDKEQQQPWNPDFTYVFGYSDWRPYTFSLLYSNYGGNRFKATEEQPVTNFNQGTWALGWKFPVTKPVVDWLTFTDDGAIGCQVDFNYTPEYFDLASTSYKSGHKTLSLGCKYSIVGNWYVNGTAFYYFDKSQQQPWNPDFTYGFGYFDWRPGTITLQYNNYSGNRWNPSQRGKDTGRFIDGSLTLAYSFSF